jgi:hypothetical protein
MVSRAITMDSFLKVHSVRSQRLSTLLARGCRIGVAAIVITIVMAWSITLVQFGRQEPVQIPVATQRVASGDWLLFDDSTLGVCRRTIGFIAADGVQPQSVVDVRANKRVFADALSPSLIGPDVAREHHQSSQWVYSAVGWPVPCLTFSGQFIETRDRKSYWRLSLRESQIGADYFDGQLPIVPVWGGLAVDAALIAITIVVGSYGAKAVRRRHWRRQGSCPKCQYSLYAGGCTGCPECGWNRSPAT